MTAGDRVGAVTDRLEAAARGAGLAPDACGRLTAALALSLERRDRFLGDPHHTDFLHTARTALVLLHDTPLNDADALTAAVLFDSEDRNLAFGVAEAGALFGPGVAAVIASLPTPAAGDELLERLVGAPADAQLVALAERLDHARRLHLRDTERWFAFHREIETVYLPVADRADATLARRFRWWANMFARRYL